jgi:hypothetical protein
MRTNIISCASEGESILSFSVAETLFANPPSFGHSILYSKLLFLYH